MGIAPGKPANYEQYQQVNEKCCEKKMLSGIHFARLV
jgi:hypothetical protein